MRTLLAVFALAVGMTATAQDYDDDGLDYRPWYLSEFVGYYNPDEARMADESAMVQLGIGKYLTERFSLAFEVDGTTVEFKDMPGGIKMISYGLTGRYHFADDPSEGGPYLGLSVGRTDHSSPFADNDATRFDLLGGVRHQFFNLDPRLFWNAELRYRFDSDDHSVPGADDFDDWYVGAGLQFMLSPPPVAVVKTTTVAVTTVDSDGDGVIDSQDRCPNTPRGTRVDRYGCPVDGDSDGDGVPDSRDKCPNTPRGTLVNTDGCPAVDTIDLPNVHFAFDSYRLRPGEQTTLDDAARILQRNPDVDVVVAGHTDSIGSDAYNQRLSEKRAKSVHDYLVKKGISASRMTTRGYGERQPVAPNTKPNGADNPEGRAKNRRVELVVGD